MQPQLAALSIVYPKLKMSNFEQTIADDRAV